MWPGIDEPTMLGNPNQGETSLQQLAPSSIWNQPPSQSWAPNIPRQNGTFPPGAPYSAPAPVRKAANPWETAGWQQPQMPPGQPSGWGPSAPCPTPAANGWGVPPPSQQQWGGTSPGGSYSDAARKGVPPAQSQNIRQNRPMDNTGNQAGWGGARVDQGTPWDLGANQQQQQQQQAQNGGVVKPLQQPQQQSNDWGRSDGTGHWAQRDHPSNNAGAGGWGNQPSGGGDMWGGGQQRQQQPPQHDSSWGGPSGPGHNNWPHEQQQQQQQQQSQNSRQNWVDPNPQNLSHWVAPGPQGNAPGWGGMSSGYGAGAASSLSYPQSSHFDTNNDMMWHDPNPKTKKVMADKGTGVWGDPVIQGDIKRWKDSSEPDSVLPANPGPSPWDGSPVAPQPPAPVPVPSSAPVSTPNNSAPAWGQSQPAATTGADWTTNNNAPVTTTVTGWGDAPKVPPVASSSPTKVIPQNGGWLPRPSLELKRQSTQNDTEPIGSSDVFTSGASNPQTPMTSFPQQVTPSSGGAGGAMMNDLLESAAAPNGSRDLQTLTQQIADQLRVAVQKGLIDIAILNQPLPQQTLLLLNQLLQRVPRLEAATAELQNLRAAAGDSMNDTQKAEVMRLNNDIQNLRQEILGYQKQINNSAPPGVKTSQALPGPLDGQNTPTTAPIDTSGGSRLNQWKNSGGEQTTSSTASTPNIEGLTIALKQMNSAADASDPWPTGKLNPDPNVDWSPPNRQASEPKLVESGNKDETQSDKSDKSATTPGSGGGVDNGVKEFIPGKKWEYQDPKDIEADMNATPSMQARQSMSGLSLNSLNTALGAANWGTGISSAGPGYGGMGMYGGGGPVNFSFGSGHTTPTKMRDDPRFNIGLSPTSNYNDPWSQRTRPPSNLGQPFPNSMGGPARLGQFNRSVSSPGQSAFAPYTNYWVIFSSVPQNSEQIIRNMCSKTGKMSAFITPPTGMGVVCVRFSDQTMQSIERISMEFQRECAPMGIQVQPAQDKEVERVLQLQQGLQQRANNQPPVMPPGLWPQDNSGWGAPTGFPAPMPMHDMLSMPPPLGGDLSMGHEPSF